MCNQGRQVWPVNFWSGFDMALNIVGVKFDQSGYDVVILTINRALQDIIALGDICDHALFNCRLSL